ncbi:MAG: ABC-F family ATP-binding cassette domain-containing protein [Verrucomicrobiota bacterium]|nr:ABC-F family ATP-binding cassette domain-containing protein [Verrucomicrobiota bacterium]
MIDFQNIKKHYGAVDIFSDMTVRINDGEKIGVVGPNGSGKSTLLKLITGEITPDDGKMTIPKERRIGYLHQYIFSEEKKEDNTTLLEYVISAAKEIKNIEKQIEDLEKKLADPDFMSSKEKNTELLGELQHRFESLDGYSLQSNVEKNLEGLGFENRDFQKNVSTFSGGWQMRAELCCLLISFPDIMLLDEPSNYLDIPAIEWVTQHIMQYKGTLLIISHDKYLLNLMTEYTLEINAGKTTKYNGNYDYYVSERKRRAEQLLSRKKNVEKKQRHLESFIDRFRAKASKATQVQSKIKMLNKMESVDVADSMRYSGTISIPSPPESGHEIIRLEDIGHTYNGKDWILKNISLQVEKGDKIGIIGYNGTGKSTLLKILSNSMKSTEGKRSLGHKVKLGYQPQEFGDILDPDTSVFETVKAQVLNQQTDIRKILGMFGFSGENIYKTCSVLSGGERLRLIFAKIFVAPPNFLILDEPTTHLDIDARQTLQKSLQNYKGTLCFVSHDIDFLRKTATIILETHSHSLTKYHGNYDYYLEKIASKKTLVTSVENKKGGKGKIKRKEKAEIRKKYGKEKRILEQKVKKLEKSIESLENEQKELVKILSENKENTNFETINKKLHEIISEINSQTEEWESAAIELEEIIEVIKLKIED